MHTQKRTRAEWLAKATRSQLYLPARVLSPGSTYTLRVQASMASDLSKRSQVHHTIAVQARDLIARIAGGSSAEFSHTDDITLDASSSTDPDVLDGSSASSALSFSWSCSVQVGRLVYACSDAKDKRELVLPNTASLTVPAGTLAPTTTSPYIFTVQISKTGKVPVSCSKRVTVRKQEVPCVTVYVRYGGQQQGDGSVLVLDVDERLALQGTCSDRNASLRWSFTPAIRSAVLDDASIFPLGTSSADLVIVGGSAAFVAGSVYSAKLTCTTASGQSSSSQVTLDMNMGPSGRGCLVCRSDGTQDACSKTGLVTDQFEIRCEHFADNDAPLRYNFGYRVVGSSLPTDVTWFAPTAANSYMTRLPSGLVTVYAFVQDKHGARTHNFATNVTVSIPQASGGAPDMGRSDYGRRLLQGTASYSASFFRGEIRSALLRHNAREVNELVSVAMTEITSGQGGVHYGALTGLNASEMRDFVEFAVRALTDASSTTITNTDYACESLGVAKLVAAATHTLAKDQATATAANGIELASVIVAVSSYIVKLATSTGVVMDCRCSESSLAAIGRLLAAHKLLLQTRGDVGHVAAALLAVCSLFVCVYVVGFCSGMRLA